MDTAPAAPTDAPDRALPGERPTIGVPSIPARTDEDPQPVPVPSIPLPVEPVQLIAVPPGVEQSAPAAEAPALPGDGTVEETVGHGATGPADGPAPAGNSPPGNPPVAGIPSVTEDAETFASAVRAKLRSYVYLLVDPRTGRPFHVGRGSDDRCFDHVRAAREGRRPAGDMAGHRFDDPVLDRIRRVEASGRPVRIEILRYGLDPEEALTVEAVAHDLLGLPGAPAGESQRRSVAEARSLLTKRAKFKRPHQVVLLRVGPTGTDASYERARHGWRIGRRWVDVGEPRSPHWAAVVVGELVDSVYRLDRWEAAPMATDGSAPEGTVPRTPERHSFVGTRDPDLERRYVGKSVAPFLGRVSTGSVSYVWCGPHWVNTAH